MSAVVTALRGNRRSVEEKIRSMCSVVRLGDVDTYRSPAVGVKESRWLKDAGFTVAQSLVMLQHTGRLPSPDTAAIGVRDVTSRHVLSPKRADVLHRLLEIDAESFPSPWNLDTRTFHHACHATSEHRVILAEDDASSLPDGYAIVGRVGSRSYLQRLAVAPEFRRRGVARALVHHASRWADLRGATTMLVNTEPTNTAALALYRSLGFDTLSEPLVVLERAVYPMPGLPA